MARSGRRVILVLAAGLAVASCGSGRKADSRDAPAAASVGTLDPCSLLTTDEVQAITTDVVVRVEPTDGGCNYHSDPDDGVEIEAYASGGAKRMATARRTASALGGLGRHVAGQGGAGADVAVALQADQTVPAIGDEAVWEPNATLAVRKGDAFVQVSPPIMHDPDTHPGINVVPEAQKREIARKIAEKLLAKLAQ